MLQYMFSNLDKTSLYQYHLQNEIEKTKKKKVSNYNLPLFNCWRIKNHLNMNIVLFWLNEKNEIDLNIKIYRNLIKRLYYTKFTN